MDRGLLKNVLVLLLVLSLTGCCKQEKGHQTDGGDTVVRVVPPTDVNDIEGLLTYYQYTHFQYMWAGARPNSGLARVRYFKDNPTKDENTLTMGASGFGIMGIIVAIERHFITRDDGLTRLEKILSFLEKAERWHGMYPHWVDDSTGKTIPFAGSNGEDDGADVHESANLIQGLLCVRQYMNKNDEREIRIAERIDAIWRVMEWDWFVDENNCILWHWSPTVGFKKHLEMTGFNETHVVYILAASSPTHPVSANVYMEGWSKNGNIVNNGSRYGIPFIVRHHKGNNEVGPLFWLAFSYSGFCPKGYLDPLGIDYWEALCNHAKIQYNYCVANPKNRACYADNCWGMSSGYTSNKSTNYEAMCTNNDVGAITANAALISMPYVPEQSIAVAKHFYWDVAEQMGPWGLWDAYSDTEGTIYKYLANNQCIVAPMIENYRSGLLWELFMSCPEIQEGLKKIGFKKQ